ncbi:MAG: DUF2309 domain-containing protein, partial [Cyclobacteriaceae bacterium]|nr:DUF2309 domain-containing protein [Cyclobacteriaceae bacterium]
MSHTPHTSSVGAHAGDSKTIKFDEHAVLHELKHYLPAQASLKDFIHHNTLHAFQNLKFYDGLRAASERFGYKVSLTLNEYRQFYADKRIREDILDRVIREQKGEQHWAAWKEKVTKRKYRAPGTPRIGALRSNWKRYYQIDLDSMVQPILFRILCSYLDQGIAIWNFPEKELGFLGALRELEKNGFSSFFRHKRATELLLNTDCKIADLLHFLVGDEAYFKQYLFDQQFAHQGWSGMVSVIEDMPGTLLDSRKISVHDLIIFELLLEIDALDFHFNRKWTPLSARLVDKPVDLFAEVQETELHQVLYLWQLAFEWSYYDQVLAGLRLEKKDAHIQQSKSFQALFCIDDRECSMRRYIEKADPQCETFGTPGFFGVEFFFQPDQGKFYTKLCPAPVTPKYLIKEFGSKKKLEIDAAFSKHSHSFYSGWIISQTLGFWSAFKLFLSIFKPAMGPATASSFKHMDKVASLTIENKDLNDRENDLQIGFTVEEMTNRVESLLKSIGLVKDFAPLVYVVGHGSSSVNNPHYAAYDCGACSGRAGSVNARAVSAMANHPRVRELLITRGITIPDETQFVGALHDTTRDEIQFFDENMLSRHNLERHEHNETLFA